MRSRLSLLAAIAALCAVTVPARAEPTPQIEAVFRLEDCSGPECQQGSDPQVKQGAAIAGVLQIVVSASGELRQLEWVRLEARAGNDAGWLCLQHWTIGDQQSFSDRYDWDTYAWPYPTVNSNCLESSEHNHGEVATNETFHMRVVARERRLPGEPVGDFDANSAEFTVKLNNAPVEPAWVADPDAESGPSVTLQWKPNPEPDLREYRIVRVGPGSQRSVSAINAKDPRKQGCTRIGNTAIRCTDDVFPPNYGGTYRYTIEAARDATAGTGTCELNGERCVATASAPRSVTVAGPTRGGGTVTPPPPTASAAPTTLPTSFASDFAAPPTIVPSASPTAGAAPVGAAGPFEALPGRTLWGPAAFVGVLGFLVWQARRWLLARR